MTPTTTIPGRFVAPSLLTATILVGTALNTDHLSTEINFNNLGSPYKAYSWENSISGLPYNIREEQNNEISYINILHRVVSDLVENSVSVSAEISKIVNKEFWNLV